MVDVEGFWTDHDLLVDRKVGPAALKEIETDFTGFHLRIISHGEEVVSSGTGFNVDIPKVESMI